MSYLDSSNGWMPPMADAGQYTPQSISGTGATEESNERAFSKDRMHLLSVGSTAVRVMFAKEKGLSNVVPASGGFIIPANQVYPFRAFESTRYGSTFVYVEAADGSSAFEVTVAQREQ